MNLTKRQATERAIYDKMGAGESNRISERKGGLFIDPKRIPFPSRIHIRILTLAFSKMGDLKSKKVLELGGGPGELSVYLAKQGAQVTYVDLSESFARLARLRAQKNGVEDRIKFLVAPVESLNFEEEFDFVFCNQVLHHLELKDAVKRIYKALKKGGRGIFCESVQLSPIFKAFRRSPLVTMLFPVARHTPTEEQLSNEDLEVLQKPFKKANLEGFQLLARAERFIPMGDSVFLAVESVDKYLLKLPILNKMPRFMLIELFK